MENAACAQYGGKERIMAKEKKLVEAITPMDQAFAQLSAADQAYLLDVYQEDVFLNN